MPELKEGDGGAPAVNYPFKALPSGGWFVRYLCLRTCFSIMTGSTIVFFYFFLGPGFHRQESWIAVGGAALLAGAGMFLLEGLRGPRRFSAEITKEGWRPLMGGPNTLLRYADIRKVIWHEWLHYFEVRDEHGRCVRAAGDERNRLSIYHTLKEGIPPSPQIPIRLEDPDFFLLFLPSLLNAIWVSIIFPAFSFALAMISILLLKQMQNYADGHHNRLLAALWRFLDEGLHSRGGGILFLPFFISLAILFMVWRFFLFSVIVLKADKEAITIAGIFGTKTYPVKNLEEATLCCTGKKGAVRFLLAFKNYHKNMIMHNLASHGGWYYFSRDTEGIMTAITQKRLGEEKGIGTDKPEETNQNTTHHIPDPAETALPNPERIYEVATHYKITSFIGGMLVAIFFGCSIPLLMVFFSHLSYGVKGPLVMFCIAVVTLTIAHYKRSFPRLTIEVSDTGIRHPYDTQKHWLLFSEITAIRFRRLKEIIFTGHEKKVTIQAATKDCDALLDEILTAIAHVKSIGFKRYKSRKYTWIISIQFLLMGILILCAIFHYAKAFDASGMVFLSSIAMVASMGMLYGLFRRLQYAMVKEGEIHLIYRNKTNKILFEKISHIRIVSPEGKGEFLSLLLKDNTEIILDPLEQDLLELFCYLSGEWTAWRTCHPENQITDGQR